MAKDKLYNKYQFREAREFLKGATVLFSYDSPTEKATAYLKGDKKYYEYWSKLEYPENDYHVIELEAVQ